MNRPLSAITVVTAIALSLLLSAWRLSNQVPDSSLDAAAAAVRERFADGELIIIDPWPQVGPRLRLGDLPLIEPKDLTPDDLAGYQRVHLLELDTIGASNEIAQTVFGAGTIERTDTWPEVELTTVALSSPARPLFDLRRDLERLTVTATYAEGTREPCKTLRRDRWVCPRNSDWSYVGREIRDIGNEPHECVWMHPLPRGGLLEVALPPEVVARRPGSFLSGGFGFTDHAAKAAQAPAKIQLLEGERVVLETSHPVSVGWHRFRIPLAPGHGPLRLTVASDNNGVAHFCVALSLMEPTP